MKQTLTAIFAFLLLSAIPAFCVAQSMQSTRVSESSNREYLFVERSYQDLDQLHRDVIKGWKEAGMSKKTIAWMSKSLNEDIAAERKLRDRFRETGLYSAKSGELIGRVDSFPALIDSVFVSDDGTFVVGLNSHVVYLSIGRDTPRADLLNASDSALFAISFGGNPNSCSVTLPDMLGDSYPIERASEGFFWASDKATIDSARGTIEIEMLDRSKTVWDVRKCKRLSPPTSSETAPSGNSFCFGSLFAVGFGFLSSGIRRRFRKKKISKRTVDSIPA